MHRLATNPPLYLVDPHDVEEGRLPSPVRLYQSKAEEVLHWARTYLCRSHTALGRDGPVCPYAQSSLDRALFWLNIYPGTYPTLEDVHDTIISFRDWFKELAPRDGREKDYKTILVMFPELAVTPVPNVIDMVQSTLRSEFISQGFMLGQFYANCQESGVWNPEFKPFCSPVPLLAIRSMVHMDAIFMKRDSASLAAYLARFGHAVPARFQLAVRQAALGFGLDYAPRET